MSSKVSISSTEVLPSLSRNVAITFVAVFVASLVGFAFAHKLSGYYPIWWSNGVLLAALLVSPKRHWGLLLAAGGVAMMMAFAHLPVYRSDIFWLTGTGMLEAGLAALLVRLWTDVPIKLHTYRQIGQFVIIAILLTPLISAVLAGALGHVAGGHSYSLRLLHWYVADALGIATVTPVGLTVYHGSLKKLLNAPRFSQTTGLLSLLALVSCLMLFQPDMALLVLLIPLIILVAIRLGWTAGGIGVLILSFVSCAFTAMGYGPFAALPGHSMHSRVFELQLFLIALTVSTAIVATVFEERHRVHMLTDQKERNIRQMTENSPDVMLLNDLSCRILYASKAVTSTLGYEPVELYHNSFLNRLLHPDDVFTYNEAMNTIRQQNQFRTLIYRLRRKDGSWIWAEGCLSLHQDEKTREPLGYVNVVRDITHRKEAEDRLQLAYNELEVLAAIDSLTGIANRRNFDAVLDSEWKRAMRSRTNTALLLIDVDCFKKFNDIYGHLQGDDCLRKIAAAVVRCIHRSTDMVARFGGEEFAVILPETDEAGASSLAKKIRATVESYGIQHTGNTYGIVTVSIGCASMVPARNSNSLPLVDAADKALYRAKNNGRNTVVRASLEEPAEAKI